MEAIPTHSRADKETTWEPLTHLTRFGRRKFGNIRWRLNKHRRRNKPSGPLGGDNDGPPAGVAALRTTTNLERDVKGKVICRLRVGRRVELRVRLGAVHIMNVSHSK